MSVRRVRRGAAAGPSGMTADHLLLPHKAKMTCFWTGTVEAPKGGAPKGGGKKGGSPKFRVFFPPPPQSLPAREPKRAFQGPGFQKEREEWKCHSVDGAVSAEKLAMGEFLVARPVL